MLAASSRKHHGLVSISLSVPSFSWRQCGRSSYTAYAQSDSPEGSTRPGSQAYVVIGRRRIETDLTNIKTSFQRCIAAALTANLPSINHLSRQVVSTKLFCSGDLTRVSIRFMQRQHSVWFDTVQYTVAESLLLLAR